MAKHKVLSNKLTKARSVPLAEQILANKSVRKNQRMKAKNRVDEKPMSLVDERLSKKILTAARRQQNELLATGTSKATDLPVRFGTDTHGDGSEESSGSEDSVLSEGVSDLPTMDPDDEAAVARFMRAGPTQRNLADIITDKITEKKSEYGGSTTVPSPSVAPAVAECYRSVRDILSQYRSGRLPKAFKMLPRLSDWERLLYLTNPDGWTAAALLQATRLFAAASDPRMTQRFYNLVLLPRVRDDIAEFHKLNVHLYSALRKALFKPAAFFKGIILPLCDSGTCTLREAVIVGSVLTKSSLPILHSAAAMLRLAEMDYTGANSIFLRLLILKKFALPYRVVDGIVYHFVRFTYDLECAPLPVLWHQSLLAFVETYGPDLAPEQRNALLGLCRVHCHHQITPEVRRELSRQSGVADGNTGAGVPNASAAVTMDLD